MEPDPTARPPTDYRRRRWLLLLVLFACLAIWTISGFLFDVFGEAITWGSLMTAGEITQGVVTRQTTFESDGTFYRLEYEYLLKDEARAEILFRGDQLVSQSFWKEHAPDTTLNIRYIPNQPGTSRIDGQPYILNLNLLTLCMAQDCISLLILLPLIVLGIVKDPTWMLRMLALAAGGMAMFVISVIGLLIEFSLDAMGLMLGWWSGGAIPFLIGGCVGLLIALLFWRSPPALMEDQPFRWLNSGRRADQRLRDETSFPDAEHGA